MPWTNYPVGMEANPEAKHIKEFILQVSKMRGQKILTAREHPLFKGKIRGKCYFSSERDLGKLLVEVDNLFRFSAENGIWEGRQRELNGIIPIDPDLFTYHEEGPDFKRSKKYIPGKDKGPTGYPWHTTQSPSYSVYLGDEIVEYVLKNIFFKKPITQ